MSQFNSKFYQQTSLIRYRRLLLICCAIVALFLVVISVIVYKSISDLQTAPAVYKHQLYSLKSGENATTVVDDFVTNPIEKQIDHLYLRFHKEYSAVQKGQYLVDGKKSLLDILKDMVAGNVVEKIYPTFTIVEGTTLAKILRKIKKRKVTDKKFKSLIGDGEKFMEDVFASEPELLEFIGGPKENLEGLICPATYPMYEEEPLYSMFKKGMIHQVKILKKEWESREVNALITTPYEALILASLIERETFLDEERETVAAVFLNRLKVGMRLQTDPSVMYGISPVFSERLTKTHLKSDTPYNTYTRYGLPPTPICMPREKTIHAALHPSDSKALYFVAKGVSPKEGHSFSRTLDEHNRAVLAYRKKVSEYRKSKKESDVEDEELITAENEAQADNKPTLEKKETAADKINGTLDQNSAKKQAKIPQPEKADVQDSSEKVQSKLSSKLEKVRQVQKNAFVKENPAAPHNSKD
ncbi:MAG: endolytic transglycosylase MltG [Succinivibrio sp.]